MFSLSAKGVYGLTALIELGLQRNNGSIQIRDIAQRHGIPQHYLEQILVVLKKAGFVESFRGAQGGYALAKDPDSISVRDVLSRLEGRVEVVAESRRDGVLRFFWDDLQAVVDRSLDRSLGDLIRDKVHRDQLTDYVI
ncbi:MAG: Rrf2 family transcriptional regulator [Spirochaetaceae bacterium]|nr:MAG: Rrf2 family transcriptional regulator [Spirochaetaceae bacterium]